MFRVIIKTDEIKTVFIGSEKDCNIVFLVMENYHHYDNLVTVEVQNIEPEFNNLTEMFSVWEYRHSYEKLLEENNVSLAKGLDPLPFKLYKRLGGDLKYTKDRYQDYLKTYRKSFTIQIGDILVDQTIEYAGNRYPVVKKINNNRISTGYSTYTFDFIFKNMDIERDGRTVFKSSQGIIT